MAKCKVVLILTMLFGVSGAAVAANTAVRQIEIKSGWGGLGKPSKTELLVLNEDGVYRLQGKVIDASAVDAFCTAIQQSPIPKPSLENLGLTKEWLQTTAEAIVQSAKKKEEEVGRIQKTKGRTCKKSNRNPLGSVRSI